MFVSPGVVMYKGGVFNIAGVNTMTDRKAAKTMATYDRTEYRSAKGVAAFWCKDGYWHTALPFKPTDRDRKLYPVRYPPGNNGPFFKWSGERFETKEEAVKAIG